MEITVNQLEKREGNIRAFASVVFEESFKVSNIAVIENKNGQCFVSMPRYASRKDDSGYKDICHPITKEFREQLYDGILKPGGLLRADFYAGGRAARQLSFHLPAGESGIMTWGGAKAPPLFFLETQHRCCP